MPTIFKMLLTILNNHRTIGIAEVIIGAIASLYGVNGFLGRPGGLLRQLLVGIPLGIITGILSYYLDVNNTFSNILKELIQSPTISISSFTIGIIGGANGLALPLMLPDLFRDKSREQFSSFTLQCFLHFGIS